MSTRATIESPADAVGTNRWYLSAAPIVRALVHVCVPMAAAMIVGAIYNVINRGFIGSQHTTAYLAAITFVTPLLGLIMGIGGMFGAGRGALISRLLGASEGSAEGWRNQARRVIRIVGSKIVGAVFGGGGLLLLHPPMACSVRMPPPCPPSSACSLRRSASSSSCAQRAPRARS